MHAMLRGSQRCMAQLYASNCCHAKIHTTGTSARDPRKDWQKFTDRMRRNAKMFRDRANNAMNYEKQNFKKVSQKTQENFKNSSSSSSSNTFQERLMYVLPTPTVFNSYFDRALRWLPSGHDLMRKVDRKYHPYLELSRVDKPIGSWLLFLPGAWGICIAAPTFSLPSVPLLVAFGAGAVMMRGAGCTINDMYDVDFDKKVIRTRNRPLASGRLTLKQATTWLAIQAGLSSLILFSLNIGTIVLGISSLSLVAAYPYMKRITDYPQLFLGLTFNYGALMGYCAYTGNLGITPLALYGAGVCWTMIYDTIYAHQDKLDDMMIGVRSTALKFGDRTKDILSRFTTGMGVGLCVAGLAAGMGPSYYLASSFGCFMILKGLTLVDLDDPKSCWEFFTMNKNIGLLILIGIILGKFA